MEMIDVITKLKEIADKSPEIASAIDSTTRMSAKKVDESVQITVSGSDAILHQILKLAGMVGAEVSDAGDGMGLEPPMGGHDMGPTTSHGMVKLPMVSPEPKMDMDHGDDHDMGPELDFTDLDREMDEMDEREYSNSPDEEVLPFDTAVPAGSDLHRAKGTYPKAAGGDNPMAQPTVYRK